MFYRVVFLSILLMPVLYVFSGCSGSNSSPVNPDTNIAPVQSPDTYSSSEIFWGLYDIAIDPVSQSVEIVPLRTPLFEANVTRFLQPPIAPVNLLSISILSGTNFAEGLVVCNVTISHPFPGTHFCGFDVRGIVMGENGTACKWDPSLNYGNMDSNSVILLNPDGWTRWWNQTEFTSYGTAFGYTEGALANPTFDSTTTLNPYKYFSDELEPNYTLTEVTPEGRGFFSAESPGINTRRYELQFPLDPMPVFRFKYAISADWTPPISGSSAPWTADDFSLSSNQAEPFRLLCDFEDSTAYYENETTYGGDLKFRLIVSDWQLLDGFLAEEQVEGIYIESPTLFDGVIDVFDPMTVELIPDMAGFLISVVVPDVTPTSLDDQVLMVHVTSVSPDNYAPQINDPIAFDWPENAVLAAHCGFTVPIQSEGPIVNQPPVADASASDPLEGIAPLTVNLDPSLSYDPDGTIVLYEWDIINDGSWEFSTIMPDVIPYEFTQPGQYEVNLRVTDNGGLDDELDDPLLISVSGPPGADFCQLQDEPMHIGDITEETDLYPPLKLDWSVPLSSGTAFWIEGTPIVGNGHVMVLYTDFSSNWAECFNAQTGESEWTVNISPSGKHSYVGTQTGAFGDGRFYTPGDRIWAIDPVDGDILWDYNPDSLETERHGLVFIDGKVMVHLHGQIHILDASNGDLIDTVGVSSGYANFQPFTLRDDAAYLQLYGSVRAYDIGTGAMLWSFTVDPPIFGSDVSIRGSVTAPGDGYVYFGCYNGYYYALDESDGSLGWKMPINGGTLRQFDTGAWADGRLYYGEGTANSDETSIPRLVCLDASDGSEIWAYKKDTAVSGDAWGYCSPIVVNGVVYAECSNGELVAVDAVTGDLLWSWDAPDSLRSDPSVADGRLYVLCEDRYLRCFINDD